MSISTNFGSILGLGLENPHATAVAIDSWRKTKSSTLDVADTYKPSGEGGAYGEAHTLEQDWVLEKRVIGGSVVSEFHYEDVMLLAAGFGAVADGGSGPSAWTHTITVGDIQSSPSFTAWQVRGTTGKVFKAAGVRCRAVSIKSTPGTPVEITYELSGRVLEGARDNVPAAPDMPTLTKVHPYQAVITYAGVTYRNRGWEIKFSQNAPDRFEHGSSITAELVSQGQTLEVSMTVDHDTSLALLKTKETDNSTGDLVITFTGTGGKSIVFTLPELHPTVSEPIESGRGTHQSKVMLRPRVTSAPVTIVCTNSTEDYNDNGTPA